MPMKNDLKEPIKFHDKGLCPVCHNRMVFNSYSSNHIFLDEFGAPISAHPTEKRYIICPACGFFGEVDKDFMLDEDMCFVYTTEAQRLRMKYIREKEKVDYIETHQGVIKRVHDSNPFMAAFKATVEKEGK